MPLHKEIDRHAFPSFTTMRCDNETVRYPTPPPPSPPSCFRASLRQRRIEEPCQITLFLFRTSVYKSSVDSLKCIGASEIQIGCTNCIRLDVQSQSKVLCFRGDTKNTEIKVKVSGLLLSEMWVVTLKNFKKISKFAKRVGICKKKYYVFDSISLSKLCFLMTFTFQKLLNFKWLEKHNSLLIYN